LDETVRLKVIVRAGGMNDPSGKEGLAHFLEHMVDEQIAMGDLGREFMRKGGHLDFTTNSRYTAFEFSIRKGPGNRRLLHSLASTAIFRPSFDQKAIDREKRIILNEKDFRSDERSAWDDVRICKTAYGEDAYQDNLGMAESIKSITADDLADFHGRYYSPANVLVSTADSSPFHEIFSDLKETWGSVPYSSPPSLPRSGVVYKGGFQHDDPDGQRHQLTNFHVAFSVPKHEGDAGKELIENVLLQYLNLSMEHEFRENGQNLYVFQAYRIPYRNQKMLAIQISSDPDRAGEILPGLSRIIADVAEGRVDRDRFATAVEAVRTTEAMERDKSRHKWDSFTPWYYHVKKTDYDYLLDRMTAADVSALAKNDMLAHRPTLVTEGDISRVQSYDEFKAMLPKPAEAETPQPDLIPA
jgi:predicted Zn-dependent peptidase